MKKIMIVVMLLVCLFAFSGCQKKEPSLADKIQQSREEADKAWEKVREAQQKEKELEDALNTLNRLKENAGY